MTLSVTIDPVDFHRLVFSELVTLARAIAFLWARPPRSPDALRPDPAERAVNGAQRRFIIDTSSVDLLLGLRQEVMTQYVSITPIRAAEPRPLPNWLPLHVREQILGFSLPGGVHRFAGTEPWGDIVVWIRRGDYMVAEVYQEFPETLAYYLDITDGDHWTANMLVDVYTHFNADMAYFVEQKGMSPTDARSEIRRINNEVFKLVLEGAVSVLTTGAGITAANNAMRAMAPKIVAVAKRAMPVRITPVGGKVNVGGGFETPDRTNLNPIRRGSGGPETGIPNHVRARMEDMDEIFEAGSVEDIFSSKLRYHDFDWPRATQAAATTMRPGGKVFMNVWCGSEAEADAIAAAFRKAGFQRAWVEGHGPGTIIHAVR